MLSSKCLFQQTNGLCRLLGVHYFYHIRHRPQLAPPRPPAHLSARLGPATIISPIDVVPCSKDCCTGRGGGCQIHGRGGGRTRPSGRGRGCPPNSAGGCSDHRQGADNQGRGDGPTGRGGGCHVHGRGGGRTMTIGRGGGCIQDSRGGHGDYTRGNDPSFVPKWAQIFILHIISLFFDISGGLFRK